jgi:hypothetical protein
VSPDAAAPEDAPDDAPAGPGPDHPLGAVLDRIAASAAGRDSVTVAEIVEGLGRRSFPALVLVPALLAVSPLSGVPGLTAAVGLIVVLTTAQMFAGRDCLWLPGVLSRRRVDAGRLAGAIAWLRRPVGFVERFLRPRLGALVRRPLVILPLVVMLAIGLAMPLLELVPTSGSLAAAAIALFAIGLLTRDGALVLAGFAYTVLVPLAVWRLAT